ncbi:MAG: hypothetical protein JRE13_15420 [Deltaproteobacteria bacterium]|nr:hypothetical protein [Deltaproteobacteria bacterium]
MRRIGPESLLLIAGVALFVVLLGKHLSYPVLWQDEAETAMFATRVIEVGYPKVHGDRNVLYEFGSNIAVGVKESTDAYIGTTWGHFFYAVPGVLWARTATDVHQKTLRVRLPFAFAGALGILVWVLALLPTFRDRPRRARVFAGLFFLSAAVSISLLLHLREARYYPLLILVVGAIAWVHLRVRVFGAKRGAVWGVSLALLLTATFHIFFAAWFFLTALLGFDALAASWHARADSEERRRAWIGTAPLLASALLVAPALVFFETFAIAASFREHLGFTLGGYMANLGYFARHFWRYELLAPAIFCRTAVVAIAFVARGRGVELGDETARRTATQLAVFIAGYVALTCVNPLVYERYFVMLSPAVIGLFLIDSFTLVDAVRRLARGRARFAAGGAIAAIALLVVATSGSRVEAVRGRLLEISTPVRGPLDFAIARILEEVPEPAELVIATNYANHPFMFYLGSHVIVGTNLNNIVVERSLVPDVVIPRRRWPRGRSELRAFLARANYSSEQLPVRDLHFNQMPALTRSPSIPDVHRFETALPTDRAPALEIFWLEPAS